jgi:hypothetical protein
MSEIEPAAASVVPLGKRSGHSYLAALTTLVSGTVRSACLEVPTGLARH